MKPRIAFCFSGQARTFDATYPYFKRNLFDAAIKQGFEYDIFCSVEDDEDMPQIHQMNPVCIEKINSNEVLKIINDKYGNFIKENFNHTYYFFEHTPFFTIYNCLQQFYKIHRSNELKNEYIKKNQISYALVAKLRYDLLFLKEINFIEVLNKVKDNKIIANEMRIHGIIMTYDQFAFGGENSMDIYMNLFLDFKKSFHHEIKGFKNKFINFCDTILVYFIRKIYKSFGRYQIIREIIAAFGGIKAYFLIKHGFTIYNCENILYEYIKNFGIKVEFSKISFLTIRKTDQLYLGRDDIFEN